MKAEYKNDIVGSVRARETDGVCLIGRLIVAPEFQNKGIGRKLINVIENEFTAAQYLLFTGYKSIKNINLYESMGYQKCEEFTDEKTQDPQLIKLIKRNM